MELNEPKRKSFEEMEMILITEVFKGDIRAYVDYQKAQDKKAGYTGIQVEYEHILARHNIIEMKNE